MNHFGSEQKTCIPAEQECNENQRTLAMELHRAADAGKDLSNMTERLFCILFGGEMADSTESNGCAPANSFSEELGRHADTLCSTCVMMGKILTMVGL